MSDKIVSPFLTKPLTLLLIILVILLIFCFMKAFFYKSQEVVFGNSHSDSHSHNDTSNPKLHKHNIKHNIIMLNKIIKDCKISIQEKFENITKTEAELNIIKLNELSKIINNIENENLEKIKTTIDNVKNQRFDNKQKILDVLTNIYILRYLEIINKGNAASYKEFIKYQNPKENTYYKQYL